MLTDAELQPLLDLLKSRGMKDEVAHRFAKLLPHAEAALGAIDMHQFPGCPQCGEDDEMFGFNPECSNFKMLAAIEHPRAAEWMGMAWDAATFMPTTLRMRTAEEMGVAADAAERLGRRLNPLWATGVALGQMPRCVNCGSSGHAVEMCDRGRGRSMGPPR